MEQTKQCIWCKELKPLEDFSKNCKAKDGRRSQCRECIKKYMAQYRKDNVDKIKQYREDNKGRINEKKKQYYQDHAEEIKEKVKQYRENNKEWKSEYDKNYIYKRRHEDPFFKFKENIKTLVWRSLAKNGYKKNSRTQEILGCSFEEAKVHLEETWFNNYGTIYSGENVHIDHIIPLSTATTEEEIIKLCHIDNLQYLKPEDNLTKSNKLDWEIN